MTLTGMPVGTATAIAEGRKLLPNEARHAKRVGGACALRLRRDRARESQRAKHGRSTLLRNCVFPQIIRSTIKGGELITYGSNSWDYQRDY